jgi:glycosyltransferase involved in cell wall biosynthesis
MSLTIGVVIPCYINHFKYIPTLLQNIADSTIKPKQVVVSCSSYTSSFTQNYMFKEIDVTLVFINKYANGSQNRNLAASYLTTDLISFIDADDLMHPKRLEYVWKTFQEHNDVSAVYHGYVYQHISERELPFWEEPEREVIYDPIEHDPKGIGILIRSDKTYPIHHAHVTVRKEVFTTCKFNESVNYWEDSVYAKLLKDNNIPMLYLNNQLSRYIHN